MLVDVDVPELTPSTPNSDPTADITQFFLPPVDRIGKSNTLKPHRKCKLCKYVFYRLYLPLSEFSRDTYVVSEASTVRRHLASRHKLEYTTWCERTGFQSRLAADVKARNLAARQAEDAAEQLRQQSLDPHLREKPERIIPYTDKLWVDAAVEWLIATDQPLDALTHPKFKSMIDIAARATNGVRIPGRKSTRAEIMQLFNDQMDKLRIQLTVS
ncbi:hypothetical protein C8J57DRAFT_1090527 [Mycena rebaudengoi]|nr:hypothetical protein C8J57DRAFT_1090527 [Mycena rebaudengoi]